MRELGWILSRGQSSGGGLASRWQETFTERDWNVDLRFPSLNQTLLRKGIHARRTPGITHNFWKLQKYINVILFLTVASGKWNSTKFVKKSFFILKFYIFTGHCSEVFASAPSTRNCSYQFTLHKEINGLSRSLDWRLKIDTNSQRLISRVGVTPRSGNRNAGTQQHLNQFFLTMLDIWSLFKRNIRLAQWRCFSSLFSLAGLIYDSWRLCFRLIHSPATYIYRIYFT